MKVTTTLLAAAATGILGALGGCAHEDMASQSPAMSSMPMSSGGMGATAKHACKGQNACKGQGGCKTDTHACKGQNACKGQGGCKTA